MEETGEKDNQNYDFYLFIFYPYKDCLCFHVKNNKVPTVISEFINTWIETVM